MTTSPKLSLSLWANFTMCHVVLMMKNSWLFPLWPIRNPTTRRRTERLHSQHGVVVLCPEPVRPIEPSQVTVRRPAPSRETHGWWKADQGLSPRCRWFLPSTHKAYNQFAKLWRFKAVTHTFPDGSMGHWMGNKAAKQIIVYLHGELNCSRVEDSLD